MFEEYTVEYIRDQLLSYIPDTMNKRQGELIYDAAAMYAEYEAVNKKFDSFAYEQRTPLTADYEVLVEWCKVFGLTPLPATGAVVEAELIMNDPTKTVDIGTRFSWETVNYAVEEYVNGNLYLLRCEQTGLIGNEAYGAIIPINNVRGLKSARITRLVIPGEEAESKEELRARLLRYLQHAAYGGNEEQYINTWVKTIQGVGGVKVIRCPEGKKARVDVYITNSLWRAPSEELIEEVQNFLLPLRVKGLPEIEYSGSGEAPIAHEVLVKPVTEVPINIKLNLRYELGYSFEILKDDIINKIQELFDDLIKNWDDRDHLAAFTTTLNTFITVSVTDINYLLHDIKGITFYEDTQVNDSDDYINLLFNEIPVIGEVVDVS